MTPELVTVFGNFIGFGVVVYLLEQSRREIVNMRQEAREDRQQLWELLAHLIRAQDSRTDIPRLPSNSAHSSRDE